MSLNYSRIASTLRTPQSEPIPGSAQVANNASGYSFAIDDWQRLERFLILGSEGGTFYVGERKLTLDSAAAVRRCIAANGPRAAQAIVDISRAGRAPKNDPALFALALACREGNDEAKRAAYLALPAVARIGTHLFHWAEYMKQLGGLGGNGAHRAIARWYARPADALAFQAIKYQQRDGWSHRDLLRKARPKPPTETHDAIYRWMVDGWPSVGDEPHPDEALRKIWAFEKAKRTTRGSELVELITKYELPHECVPNEAKSQPMIWEALLPSMGMTALIRNLGKMTSVGLLGPMSPAARAVCDRLGDVEQLRKGRVHPLAILVALKIYAQGHGDKGSLSWVPNQQIVSALSDAFYLAFHAVEPTGKRHLVALDVSGSMSVQIAGSPLSAREASTAMALVTAAVEREHHVVAFTSGPYRSAHYGHGSGLIEPGLSPKMRLTEALEVTGALPFGGTDCALPMLWALERKVPVDAFCVYTDSETWAGDIHPMQALREYRQKMGIPAKLIVVGMCANEFTIADPFDAGSLDVVGFDTATPAVLADFVRA